MYVVYLEVDDEIIPRVLDSDNINDKVHKLISPQLEMEDNAFGSFSFIVPKVHEHYSCFDPTMSNRVTIDVSKVIRDGETETMVSEFKGRILEVKVDSQLNRSVMFEGELSYLGDSVQEPAEYEAITPAQYLAKLFEVHNRKFPDKKFYVGTVTVTDDDSADHITGRVNRGSYSVGYSNSTWACIQSMISELGGHIVLRYDGGDRYIDYLKEYTEHSGQSIDLGANLLDYAEEWTLAELYTVIIPLGADLTEEYTDSNGDTKSRTVTVNIASVNNGSVYYENSELISRYGRREKVVEFKGIADPGHLKQIAKLYMDNQKPENTSYSLTALDLYDLGADVERLRFQTIVDVTALPFGLLNFPMPIMKVSIPLKDPAHAIYSMSANSRGIRSLSTKITDYDKDAQDAINDLSDALDDVKEQVTKVIATQSAEPDDWMFGIPQIVFPEDEFNSAALYHTSYISRVWSPVVDGVFTTVQYKQPNLGDAGADQELHIKMAEVYGGKTSDAMKITHGVIEDSSTEWANISTNSSIKSVVFPYGVCSVLPVTTLVNNEQEDGCRVVYIVAKFKANTKSMLGCTTRSSGDQFLGAKDHNGVQMLFEYHDGSSWGENPIRAYPARNGPPTSDEQPAVNANDVVVIAIGHGIVKSGKYDLPDDANANMMFGTTPYATNDLISAVRVSKTCDYILNANSDGIRMNYYNEFSSTDPSIGDEYTKSNAPALHSDDHEMELIRAVECRTKAGGMITVEEVIENVAWLVGRFVVGAFADDSAELPEDGMLGGGS